METPTQATHHVHAHGHSSKFWQFNLGHLLMLVTLVAGGFASFLAYDRGIFKLKTNQDSLIQTVDSLADKVKAMDQHGTAASQHQIKVDHAITEANARSLDATQEILTNLGPKIQHLGDNLDILTQWIQRQDKNLILPRRSPPPND